MKNLQVGDLALVISSRIPENIGKVVKIIGVTIPGQRTMLPDGGVVMPVEEVTAVVEGWMFALNNFNEVLPVEFGAIHFRKLMPLHGDGGDFELEQTKEKEQCLTLT